MTPQELKTSILWAAIQGKITRQAEGESAEELLTGLSLSALAEEECYFDIPGNWKWCKIKDIFTLHFNCCRYLKILFLFLTYQKLQ